MKRYIQHTFLAAIVVAGMSACSLSVGSNFIPPHDHRPITTVPTDRDVIYQFKVKGVD